MSAPLQFFLIFVGIMSVLSVIVCIYDKLISRLDNVKLRIPEKSLFVFSGLGGSVAMLICMLLIRHKTKHKSFMIGIPAIIVLQAVLVYLCFHFEIFAF